MAKFINQVGIFIAPEDLLQILAAVPINNMKIQSTHLKSQFIKKEESNKGFMAITSLLIISAIALSISISMTIVGINAAQNSLSLIKGTQTLKVAESCLEEALIRLKANSAYSGGSLNIDNASCTITITSTGANKTIDITSTTSGPPDFVKHIQATARTTGTSINLLNWQEI